MLCRPRVADLVLLQFLSFGAGVWRHAARGGLGLALLASVVACADSDPVESFRRCTEASCQSATIEAAYAAAPEQTASWLSELSDPVVQAGLLEQLAFRFPEDAPTLCAAVPANSVGRQRCHRRNNRPHLSAGTDHQKRRTESSAVAAAGSRTPDLPVSRVVDPPWESGDPIALSCGTQPPDLCALSKAQEAAEAGGSADVIGGACRTGFPELGRSYSECLFKAAEHLGRSHGAAGIPAALQLCQASVYAPMCVAHLTIESSPPVPSADTFTDEDIDAAMATAAAFISSAPEHGAIYADRFWSAWVFTSYHHAATVHGGLLERLPAEARHHVAAAAAHRLMTRRVPSALDAAVAEVSAALRRRPSSVDPVRYTRARSQMIHQTWLRDWPGEELWATTWVMGPARRVRAMEPNIDRQIAVLEAAGQLKRTPPADFFFDVLDGPTRDPRVRWTAARLGAFLAPEQAAALVDSERMVQARLSHRPKHQHTGPRPPEAEATEREAPRKKLPRP